MRSRSIIVSVVLILGIFTSVFGQQHTENGADQALRGSGRVNPSTLGMEIDIPLGSYPGRGINVPVSLSYSSKLWRMEYNISQPAVNNPDNCISLNYPVYGENTASGWTTSLAVPYVEYTGADNLYQDNGFPLGMDDSQCTPNSPPNYSNNAYIRRITIHLPSGETHELRMDDTVKDYPASSSCPGSQCDADDPTLAANWSGWYYAADGSNIKYYEDRTNNSYYLQMPDGSKYEFVNSITNLGSASIRKANKFIDRNGNYTTYNDSNGTWTDTLGKTIAAPFGLSAPTSPNTQTYSMPGMTGTYKFYWKKLKDSTEAESALTNFNQSLKYMADRASANPNTSPRTEPYLFSSDFSAWAIDSSSFEFNPVVLAEIELPTGQKYKFTYDIYGRIERIYYPTGGEERFEYNLVGQLAHVQSNDINTQTNFGVTNRKVYTTAGTGTPLEWTYGTAPVTPNGLKVTTTAPDDTKTERYLHRSLNSTGVGNFGYDTNLAGMPYEEHAYNSNNQIVSKKLTTWTKTSLSTSGGTQTTAAYWHPRVTQSESIIYEGGSGISATTKYEYEGDLSYRDTPLLQNKVEQYGFVVAGNSLPSNPVRTIETTYLINDSNYSSVRSNYVNQNMIGLVTASVVKDSAGSPVARSEMSYDEVGTYPILTYGSNPSQWQNPNTNYRGNPTTMRSWKDIANNQYITTHAQFDSFGNQRKVWDGRGNMTETDYTSPAGQDYKYAFPTKVKTPIPDPNPSQNPDGLAHGSPTAFEATATFNSTTGLPLTTVDANGLEMRIEYDTATLRPLNTKTYFQGTQVGSTSEIVYHDEENNYWVRNRTQIDANNWAESISYFDGLGRAYKAEQVDSQGNIFVEKEFDAEGRVSRVTNPYRNGETKQWTTNTYDESSRIKEVTLPDGAKVTTDYGISTETGLIGVTKQITDQAGKKRKGISDALGRMIRVIEDPTGQNLSTDYDFDTLGNLRKTTQGEQNRFFMYDSLGRLLYAKQPEQEANTAFVATDSITNNSSWSVKYQYDDNGNITSTTDAKGVSVAGTYDNLNRLIYRNYSDSTPDVGFFYDGKYLDENGVLQTTSSNAKGKTTGVSSSVSRTNYTSFNNLGQLLTHQQITDGRTFATSYEYDAYGKMISETYPSGRTVKTDYNADGDVSSIWGTVGSQNRLYANGFSYNSAGAIERMRLGNGKWETAKYNERLQVTEIGLGNSATDTSLLKLEYGYGSATENNGNLRTQKISFNGLSQPFEQTYTYDSLNRLESAEEKVNTTTWKQTFSYDRYGNRRFNTNGTNTTTLGSCSQSVCNPLINTSDNRIKKDQNDDQINEYDYDKNGNLTRDAGSRKYTYDAENHQTKVETVDSNGNTIATNGEYLYDGEGRRIKKTAGTELTIFVYDASGQLVAEYSTLTAQTPQVSYLTQDHLGSARVITDQNGAVTTRKDYMAFGEEASSVQRTSNPSYDQSETRKGYTGYEKDTESGLEFAQARYYNSQHGRFTSVDPLTASATIRNPQTFNRYSYGLNSPYKFTDPLGLISSSTGAYGSVGDCDASYSGCYDGRDNGGFVDPVATHEESHTNEAEAIPATAIPASDSQQQVVEPDPPPPPDEKVVPETDDERAAYNCLAWALGLTDVWIEPTYSGEEHLAGYTITRNRTTTNKGVPTYLPGGRNALRDGKKYTMVGILKNFFGAEESVKINGKEIEASLTSETPAGYYKIVVWEKDGEAHVIRQDADGTWSSKNGGKERVVGIKNPETYYNKRNGTGITPVYLFRKIEDLGKLN